MSEPTLPVAVVTGGAAGMGLAHVRGLLDDGWAVCAVDRNESALRAMSESTSNEHLYCITADLQDGDAPQRILDHVLNHLGHIDGLVNNAGYGLKRPLMELNTADLLDQLGIHVEAAIELSNMFAPYLSQRSGSIVNISSTYGLAGPCTYPNPPTLAYCSAKAAVIGITRAMSHTLAPHVRVNAVAPGGARTEMTLAKYPADLLKKKEAGVPMQRWAEPHEYAHFVRYLLSPISAPLSGQVLSPNGGEVMVTC